MDLVTAACILAAVLERNLAIAGIALVVAMSPLEGGKRAAKKKRLMVTWPTRCKEVSKKGRTLSRK
jgi:hypothetical protein